MLPVSASVFALALLAPPPAPVLSVDAAKKIAVQKITAQGAKQRLTFIASDALEGRDTPSAGLDAAAQFIVYELSRLGAKPAGDQGTFFQRIDLQRPRLSPTQSLISVGSLEVKGDALEGNGVADGTGQLVIVRDNLDGIDVKGKVVLLPTDARPSMESRCSGAGALATIRDSGWPSAAWRTKPRRGGWEMPNPSRTLSTDPARISVSSDTFRSLMEAQAADPAATAKVKAVPEFETIATQNVVALVEGSDPVLKDEMVALGAHYDHVGTRASGPDRIYNGADDDGSGTVALMGIAEAALSGPRPKRSLLFVWHCGEEKGLWGSAYFNTHPTVPVSKIVAQLNIDMIGRSKAEGDTNQRNKNLTGPQSVYVIGTTMMSTRLGQLVHETNKSFLKFGYDSRYDSPDDREQFFYRSDHYNYAKNGIPICFWFDGVHEDYHQVGDEVSKIDFNKLSRIAQTVFVTAVAVANEPTRPAVDKPLNR